MRISKKQQKKTLGEAHLVVWNPVGHPEPGKFTVWMTWTAGEAVVEGREGGKEEPWKKEEERKKITYENQTNWKRAYFWEWVVLPKEAIVKYLGRWCYLTRVAHIYQDNMQFRIAFWETL